MKWFDFINFGHLPFKSSAKSGNQYYIEKYKDFDGIIMTYYGSNDKDGNMVLVDGTVTPLKIDNRQLAAPTDQQGNKPHCAGYSVCNWAEAVLWKRTGKLYNLDADQVYAKAKQLDGDVDGEGTYLECAIKAAIQLGGFETKNLKIDFVFNDMNQTTIDTIKMLVHRYDFVHCGLKINEGWYKCNNKNYVIKPSGRELGGHAVLIVGYDQQGVYIQNSWGKSWGANGFCILPWDEFLKEFIYGCFITGLFNE